MKSDETNYEGIEYYVLRTVIENDPAISPGFAMSGYDIDTANQIKEAKMELRGLLNAPIASLRCRPFPTELSFPLSKDGKKVEYTAKDIDLKNLEGVHIWRLMKNAKRGEMFAVSERKVKECVSYLLSEGLLKYESNKRFYITLKGIQVFLAYAQKFAMEFYSEDFALEYSDIQIETEP